MFCRRFDRNESCKAKKKDAKSEGDRKNRHANKKQKSLNTKYKLQNPNPKIGYKLDVKRIYA